MRASCASSRELLGASGFELARQSDFGIAPPPETGATFLENALIKARNAARLAGAAGHRG